MLPMVLRTSGIFALPNTYKPIMSYKLMLSNATDGAPYLGHFRLTQHLQAYYVVQVNAKQCYRWCSLPRAFPPYPTPTSLLWHTS